MAHAIWTGSINFGLVNIPVRLLTAVRENELHFNLLHNKDKGRINNVRVCKVCGKKVEWDDLIKGYEYDKGDYVLMEDEDFKKVNPEATQSIDITEFVEGADINPMYFDKPYYLEPEKKGRHAYALLREALKKSGKVGIARVVIRTREYLAALRPNDDALVLELMHFADELVDQKTLELPEVRDKVPPGEMKAAMMLIDTMAGKFDPESYHDKYREELMAMIEARAKGKPLPKVKPKKAAPDKVVNLMDVLQESLRHAGKRGSAEREAPAAKPARSKRRVAAVA